MLIVYVYERTLYTKVLKRRVLGSCGCADSNRYLFILKHWISNIVPNVVPDIMSFFCALCSPEMRAYNGHQDFSVQAICNVAGASVRSGHVDLGTHEIVEAQRRAKAIWNAVRLNYTLSSSYVCTTLNDNNVPHANVMSSIERAHEIILGRVLDGEHAHVYLQNIDKSHFHQVKSKILYFIINLLSHSDPAETFHIQRFQKLIQEISYQPGPCIKRVLKEVQHSYTVASRNQNAKD